MSTLGSSSPVYIKLDLGWYNNKCANIIVKNDANHDGKCVVI